jgi:F-type H+-transporting ATPase subunit epsilon
MAETFVFELVAPERLLVSKPVAMVTLPGGEGDYGVLAGHAPMITTVRAGVISVYADNENTVTERIFVAGGFAEVNAERCTVLAEEAIPVADLDRPSIDLHIKMLLENAALATTDAERDASEAELAIARAKLEALAA